MSLNDIGARPGGTPRTYIKTQDLLLIRKFVRRIKSKRAICQILERAAYLGPYLLAPCVKDVDVPGVHEERSSSEGGDRVHSEKDIEFFRVKR